MMKHFPAIALLLLFVPPPTTHLLAATLEEVVGQTPPDSGAVGTLAIEGVPTPAQGALEPTIDYSVWGVPRIVSTLTRPVPFLGMTPQKGGGAVVAQRFFAHFASDFPVLDWAHIELNQISEDVGPLGWTVYRVSQSIDGIPVRHSDMVLHVDSNGALRYFHGNFYSDMFAAPLDFVIEYDEAAAKASANLEPGEKLNGMELQYVDTSVSGTGPQALKPMYLVFTDSRVFQLDGVTGLMSVEEPVTAYALQMEYRNVNHIKQLYVPTSWSLPVFSRLSTIYNRFGTWGWQSYDGKDSPMRVYYNYCFCDGTDDNCLSANPTCDCTQAPPRARCLGLDDDEHEPQFAFWYDGTDAVNLTSQVGALRGCGDGLCTAGESCGTCEEDCGLCPASCGNGVCDDATESCLTCPGDCGLCAGPGAVVDAGNDRLDILAHEFAHGFNRSTSQLIYERESGALAEGFADCFAAMVDTANWTLFESSGFTTFYGTSAARSLEDPHLTDLTGPEYSRTSPACASLYPHVGHCADHFLERSSCAKDFDFGGVHQDAGVFGKACWLLGTSSTNTFYGVTVEGQGRSATGYVFHYAQRQFLTSTSRFFDARAALTAAAYLWDAAQGDPSLTMTVQTAKAMDAVGVWSKSGNVGASLKNRTRNPVAAVEQTYGTSYRRFIFYREEEVSNPRLKYLRYIPGTGWSKWELPTQISMNDIPPATGETVYSGTVQETSVFYQTDGDALTRVRVRNGLVFQPPGPESLGVDSPAQVAAVSAGGINYGIAYRHRTGAVYIKYATRNSLDDPLVAYSNVPVLTNGSQYNYVYPISGLSMTRGDGRVWLLYMSRRDIGGGEFVQDDICVTSIPESQFAWDYPDLRIWDEPTCFDSPVCDGAQDEPSWTDWSRVRAPALFAYKISASMPTRYYIAYINRDYLYDGDAQYFPVVFTFLWDAEAQEVSGVTRPVMYRQQSSFVNVLPDPDIYGTPAVGGFLADTQGNLRLYYTDSRGYVDPLGDYITELMKHGY